MTDRIEADGNVIKRDGKGRVRMLADQREKLLEEFERSGICGPQFAAVVGRKPGRKLKTLKRRLLQTEELTNERSE